MSQYTLSFTGDLLFMIKIIDKTIIMQQMLQQFILNNTTNKLAKLTELLFQKKRLLMNADEKNKGVNFGVFKQMLCHHNMCVISFELKIYEKNEDKWI